MSGTPRYGLDGHSRWYGTGSGSDLVLSESAVPETTRSLPLPVPYHLIQILVCRAYSSLLPTGMPLWRQALRLAGFGEFAASSRLWHSTLPLRRRNCLPRLCTSPLMLSTAGADNPVVGFLRAIDLHNAPLSAWAA